MILFQILDQNKQNMYEKYEHFRCLSHFTAGLDKQFCVMFLYR